MKFCMYIIYSKEFNVLNFEPDTMNSSRVTIEQTKLFKTSFLPISQKIFKILTF